MVTVVNSKAEVLKAASALAVNCNAAKGLMDIMKTNLGPRGTLKMLVGGAGQIKITKDGCVLLKEMQIQHPTASMIARAATAQDDITGDGTTSTTLFMGELMRQAERLLQEGVHPRQLTQGIDAARQEVLNFLETCKQSPTQDRELHMAVARTSLCTKLHHSLAEKVSSIVVDAVQTIRKEGEAIDLHMVEIMHMKHKMATDTQLVRGLVMDHGVRHDGMAKNLKNCYILTCNVSLEYEKSEVNSGFFYSSAEQRDKLVESERKFTDEKVKQIIDLKNEVCTDENKKSFVVLNMKGIDPQSLDMLAKAGIMALRRVKRRNMERLTLACGGVAVNSCDDLSVEDLGFAGHVYEQPIGEEKYTFVEDVQHPLSCTILIKGTYDHTIAQVKDAVRDGLRAVLSVVEDGCVIPGAGAFEVGAYVHLENFKKQVSGKPRLGVEAFAKALLIIPATLAENSGLDAQDMLLKLVEVQEKQTELVGLDLDSGEPISPALQGVWDSYRSKKQIFNISPTLAQQLLLCDEIIRAGKQMKKE